MQIYSKDFHSIGDQAKQEAINVYIYKYRTAPLTPINRKYYSTYQARKTQSLSIQIGLMDYD